MRLVDLFDHLFEIMEEKPDYRSFLCDGQLNLCGTTRFRHKYNAFNLAKELINTYDGDKVDNVSVVPVNVNVDCINNYKTESVAANAYTTATVSRLVDNVHPYYDGYEQVGHSLYAYIKSFF